MTWSDAADGFYIFAGSNDTGHERHKLGSPAQVISAICGSTTARRSFSSRRYM